MAQGTVVLGDALEVEFPQYHLAYLDPPYGPKRAGKLPADSYYGVGSSREEYLSFLLNRIQNLTKGQSDYNLIVHVDPKYSHHIKVGLDDLLGQENFRNEIVWCYSGPSNTKSTLPKKHDVLLWYGVGNYYFHQPRIPYATKNGKPTLRVGGKTGWKNTQDTQQYLQQGKPLEDFWTDVPALQRNEGEKLGYATQKPVRLLERIVTAFSPENGMVVDPFSGSGTTARACKNLNRNFFGCDMNPEAVDLANASLV